MTLDDLHHESAEISGDADVLFVLEGVGTVGVSDMYAAGMLTLWPSGETVDGAAVVVPGLVLDQISTLTDEEAGE